MKFIFNILSAMIIASLLVSSYSYASPVSSSSVMSQQAAKYNKDQLLELVSREDVQNKLASLGVEQSTAIARIEAMTDQEVSQLNKELTQGKAGAGIVGGVLTVLAVIAILDLVGVTDVYPFIRPI